MGKATQKAAAVTDAILEARQYGVYKSAARDETEIK